jgi:D-glycerate 3-kinase
MPEHAASDWRATLLERHQLDSAYLDTARTWFDPLASTLAAFQQAAGRPVLVALNGCQGSGKTTLCDYLCTALAADHALVAVALSLDDFYLTHIERQTLASTVHPLLATRGVPGTHDMDLLQQTLEQLLHQSDAERVAIPRFDKALDDRRPRAAWDVIDETAHVILLEGWCLGAGPEPGAALINPVNSLERDEDPAGLWRDYINEALANEFAPLYALVDQWIMLHAPSFDCVFEWRREQESKLAATLPPEQADGLMGDDTLRRFIQHFERLTRQCLRELPARVNHLFSLDHERRITDYLHRASAVSSP